MLRFIDAHSRREWLRLGGLAGLGWGLPGLMPAPAAATGPGQRPPGFGRAKSIIVLFASGGQSQIDTWDPKPHAPAEIRGNFTSIPTAIPGVRFCEHMPHLARLADRFSLVRSMSHEDVDHGSAFYLSMTGRYHRRRSANPLPGPDDSPGYSSILQRVRPSRSFARTSVHLNGPAYVPNIVAPGQFGGFLGKRYDPFTLGDVSSGEIVVPGLEPHRDLPPVRVQARRDLLSSIESSAQALAADHSAMDMHSLYEQAFTMLDRPQTRDAFRLNAEPDALRNRYGRYRAGQACLLARRLVEAGCPMVTVMLNHNNRGQDTTPDDQDAWGWDTHNDIFVGLRDYLLPRFDQTVAALLEDLETRGLLDETLVVCMGEFGRAPLVALEKRFAGSSPGRKHWSRVYSIMLAGAGVRRGGVVGISDAQGAYPTDDSYGPWDVVATMFSALGIDPAGHYTNLVGQPFQISEGRVISGLYAG
ncbi:MAG: DUF1501 domain-containing protein [Maioricimonas sp. JB049]